MIPFLSSATLPARHGFFTRHGGVSTGLFDSLNCSLSSADDPANVAENRARVARALGGERLVGLHQVHGADVAVVTDPWLPGEGPKADAMVTARPGVTLGIITADCTPVLLHAPLADGVGVVGAVHAGWRSAVSGILENTVAAMVALGADPAAIRAAIGPCIRQASYQVGADLRGQVVAHDPAHARFFAPDGPAHWRFDLAGYCAARLSGIAVIDVIDADTMPDDRFWSHRRRTLARGDRAGHPIGHQISAIVL